MLEELRSYWNKADLKASRKNWVDVDKEKTFYLNASNP